MKNQIKLGTGEVILFKNMPSKSKIRTFFNDRFYGRAKVKRIISYNLSGLLIEVNATEDIVFNPPYGYLQSVNIKYKRFVIAVPAKEFPFLYNEIDFFRRFPQDAKKRGVQVI